MSYRDDAYYIERVLHHGDTQAFAGLINKHKTMAFNIALRITGNREDAEEVAQDAFVKLYNSLNQFRGDSKFTTWFFRIVYNLGLTKVRKKSLFTGSVDDENFQEIPLESDSNMVDAYYGKEKRQFVNKALSTLDEGDRLLITLFYMDDQPVDSIAEITGLTQSNVKVKLFRARKKLHDALSDNLKDELQSIM